MQHSRNPARINRSPPIPREPWEQRMNLDVLVLGAGPAGSVLAHRLASRGFQVAVVESQKFPRYAIGETLTPGVESLLKQAQVLSAFRATGLSPYYREPFCLGLESPSLQCAFAGKQSLRISGGTGRI